MRRFGLFIAVLVAILALHLTCGTAIAGPREDIEALRSQAIDLYRDRKYAEAAAVAEKAVAQAEEQLGREDELTGVLLRNLAVFYAAQGKRDQVEALTLRAIAILEKAKGPDDWDLFVAVDVLARHRLWQKRPADAIVLFQRGLAIEEKHQGPDSPELVSTLDDLAIVLAGLRRFDEVEPLRKRIVAIVEKAHGADSTELLPWLDKLGKFYSLRFQNADAEAAYQRALAISEKAHGTESPELVPVLAKLAEVYATIGQQQYASAEQVYKRILAIVEKAQGADHIDLRAWHDALGKIYERQSRADLAEAQYKRSLELVEKARGPDHPDAADALDKLARTYTGIGKREDAKAEPLYQRMLAILEKDKGPDSTDLVPVLDKLASVYQFTRRYPEGEAARKRALAILETQLGPDHADVAAALEKLASLYTSLALRDYDKAEPLYKRAVAIREKTPSDFRLSSTLLELASLYTLWKRPADAEPYYRRLVAMREQGRSADDPSLRLPLENLAENVQKQGRFAEAEQLYRRVLAIVEKASGPDHSYTAQTLGKLAKAYEEQSRYGEAEPLRRRLLERAEKQTGSNSAFELRAALRDLAKLLQDAGRPAEAEPLLRRAIAVAESSGDSVFYDLIDLASVLQETNQLAEAEKLLRQAHKLAEEGRAGHEIARSLNALASLLQEMGQPAEAEAMFRQSLALNEGGGLPQHIASVLNNLALLLQNTGRAEDAEPLLRRSLAIDEELFGPDHPETSGALNNLASLLIDARRFEEAEPLLRRSLAILEKALGPDHARIATRLNNLAVLLKGTDRLAEAEALLRRAVAIDEKSYGRDHPKVAVNLNNLGEVLMRTGRLAESEEVVRRALTIDEASYGPTHRRVETDIHNLAVLRGAAGDWAEVVSLYSRARPALIGRQGDVRPGDRSGLSMVLLKDNARPLRQYARALHRLGAQDAARREEGFVLAQWALQTEAAEALAQMSARFGKGEGPMVELVRERQNLIARRQSEDKRLLAASGEADTAKTAALRASIAEIDHDLDRLDAELARQFPDYADLTNPKPLAVPEVQGLLNGSEALVLFLDVGKVGPLEGETLVWVVTREKAGWRSVALDADAVTSAVMALRCGLDQALWTEKASAQKCLDTIKTEPGTDKSGAPILPFDLSRAHALYTALFGPDRDILKDKQLLIVPSGSLTSLPFGVLVTEPPVAALPATPADYRHAAWLGTRQPLSILPSVTALKALRRVASNSGAKTAYFGVGNPLLDGDGEDPAYGALHRQRAQAARQKQHCAGKGEERIALAAGRALGAKPLLRGAHADIEQIRTASPLPETADELCRVGQKLSAREDDILLGERASETTLKELSAQGRLADYRILHFATHGALTGQVDNTAEPGLILTPPPQGTSDAQALWRDDGYLAASEIASLKLDADWVILSACNTASGTSAEAEALSGLARAFFYAGARSLLVSHWEVESHATVKLVTGAFDVLAQAPQLSRAEAVQRSIRALASSSRYEAHPAFWAPFTVVGADPSLTTASISETVPPLPVRAPAAKIARDTQDTPDALSAPPKKQLPRNWIRTN